MGEIHFGACDGSQGLMACTLLAIVNRDSFPHSLGESCERLPCLGDQYLGRLPLHREGDEEFRLSLDECADVAFLPATLDSIALPITTPCLLVDYGGPLIDLDTVGYQPAPIPTGTAYAAFLVPLPEVGHQI
jgi:hypothetical protein